MAQDEEWAAKMKAGDVNGFVSVLKPEPMTDSELRLACYGILPEAPHAIPTPMELAEVTVHRLRAAEDLFHWVKNGTLPQRGH